MFGYNNDRQLYKLEKYQFDLPSRLIAQFPVEPRDSSRLLVLDRASGIIKDAVFHQVIDYLEPGDALVINNTRVIPARLYAYKKTGARVEILLLKKEGKMWQSLVKPAKRLRPGTLLSFPQDNTVQVEIVEELELPGGRLINFINCPAEDEFIERVGQMPLPPYIKRLAEDSDRSRYQTVYASDSGSAAAPTAGLHFTEQLLQNIQDKGVNIARIVLHVGLGTFRPVLSDDIRDHHMHYEYFNIEKDTAALLNDTRQRGKKVVAVGSTVVRTLETVYNEDCGFNARSGETNKFIYPGYRYRAVDRMITNFHLPGSSLLMLVAAFAGYENTMRAYEHAINNEYRFFSYGDAMLIK